MGSGLLSELNGSNAYLLIGERGDQINAIDSQKGAKMLVVGRANVRLVHLSRSAQVNGSVKIA